MGSIDRFARVAALRPVPGYNAVAVRPPTAAAEFDPLAQLLGARVRKNSYGEHLSLQQWFSTPDMFSPNAQSLRLALPPGATCSKAQWASLADPAQWLFLDTETTGISGGTGTYAFMVGIAWWDAGGLQVEQLFMRDLDEEHSLLLELAERMAERPVLVTFNGKSFDWPLLETRYRMTRSIPCPVPAVHLDFLHPARHLWRLRLGSVRLQELERHVLVDDCRPLDWSRHDDINSSLIPQMYFDFLRGGAVEAIAGVFRHNQMDLRGLAALVAKVLTLLDTGMGISESAHPSAHDPVDLCGLSKLLYRRGEVGRARELYEAALETGLPRPVARIAQRELARLAKKQLDYDRARSLWERLRDPAMHCELALTDSLLAAEDAIHGIAAAIDAAEQLAIYYEHRSKQPELAADIILAATGELRAARKLAAIDRGLAARIEQRLSIRLARLQLRIGRSNSRKKPQKSAPVLPYGPAPSPDESDLNITQQRRDRTIRGKASTR